jgi:hypothetical protein
MGVPARVAPAAGRAEAAEMVEPEGKVAGMGVMEGWAAVTAEAADAAAAAAATEAAEPQAVVVVGKEARAGVRVGVVATEGEEVACAAFHPPPARESGC